MPGSSFATAELLDAWEDRDEFLPGSTGEHYYRFTISNATNNVQITGTALDSGVSPGCEIEIYDGSEALIHAANDNGVGQNSSHRLTDLATGTYYVVVYDAGGTQDLAYNLMVYLVENGVHPSVIHTDDIDVTMEVDEFYELSTAMYEFDNLRYNEPLSPYYVVGENEKEFTLESDGKNVPAYKTRNPLVINGVNNNRILGRQTEAQYSVKGTVKREGVAVENGLLRLYDRASGELIDQTYSDGAGNYSFAARIDPNFKYYVIAFDDVEAPILQAVIHDFLDPILETL